MGTFIGIDGIRNGWVAVYLHADGRQCFAHAPHLRDLLDLPFARAMIDMPVGLPMRGYRSCDEEARKKVGPRAFLGARWGVWQFETHQAANQHYWEVEAAQGRKGKGISLQLWSIRHKLREVNELIAPAAPAAPALQTPLMESHPELVFRRLAGGVLESKKTAAGRDRRVALLKQNGFDDIDAWLGKAGRRGKGIGRDDLIDACACALAARDRANRIPALPAEPPRSEQGIRMEIWY